MDRSTDPFFVSIHKLGKFSTILVILTFIFVPFSLSVFHNITVNYKDVLIGIFTLLSFMGPLAVGEFLGYAPVLGPSLYLSLMTGNTMNMKIPAVLSSLQAADTDASTKEGEIIKILAVGTSSLVATTIIIIGMLSLGYILPLLTSETLSPAFENILPCMMGALVVPIALKALKHCIFPTALVILAMLTLGYATVAAAQSILILVVMILTTLFEYFCEKRAEKLNDNVIDTDT